MIYWQGSRTMACAMNEVGLLVREGGDKGGRWIVKKTGC